MDPTASDAMKIQPGEPSECVDEWARRYKRAGRPHVRSLRRARRRGETALIGARQRTYRIAKRAFDCAFAAVLLLVSSPLMCLIAIAIKLTDGGPALFWQQRVGIGGEIFAFPRFRSTIPGADSMSFRIKRDQRVTWIGRLMRRFSLDEFPQLWCVLCGHMSLVGPRPALPREVDNYTQEHRRRLGVRPGLTCIWQVSGRGEVPFERQVQMDVEYVESHSFWLDVKLVVSTVPAVLSGRGAC
jgi:lipopolysaccharide/colanic/teichoic acid biosynthesis glycosyltransferase